MTTKLKGSSDHNGESHRKPERGHVAPTKGSLPEVVAMPIEVNSMNKEPPRDKPVELNLLTHNHCAGLKDAQRPSLLNNFVALKLTKLLCMLN